MVGVVAESLGRFTLRIMKQQRCVESHRHLAVAESIRLCREEQSKVTSEDGKTYAFGSGRSESQCRTYQNFTYEKAQNTGCRDDEPELRSRMFSELNKTPMQRVSEMFLLATSPLIFKVIKPSHHKPIISSSLLVSSTLIISSSNNDLTNFDASSRFFSPFWARACSASEHPSGKRRNLFLLASVSSASRLATSYLAFFDNLNDGIIEIFVTGEDSGWKSTDAGVDFILQRIRWLHDDIPNLR
ncbi:hypothetical protein KCU74_g35, partial [Aureobasidium melanogenum]